MHNITDNMNVGFIDDAIQMLNTYAKEDSLKLLNIDIRSFKARPIQRITFCRTY